MGGRGEGDRPRVHLPERGDEIPGHRPARAVDLGRDRVQLRRDRAHTGHRHPRRLCRAGERGRQREHHRRRHGPAVAHPVARRDPPAPGPGRLRDARPVAQPDPAGAALLQLDDGGGLRAGRPGVVRARHRLPGALRPGAPVARRRGRAFSAPLPRQRVRGKQVLPRCGRAERLLRRLLPRRWLWLGTLGPSRGDARAQDVAVGAVPRRRHLGGSPHRHRRTVRRVPGGPAARAVPARSGSQPHLAGHVRPHVGQPLDRGVVPAGGDGRPDRRLPARRHARRGGGWPPSGGCPGVRGGCRHGEGVVRRRTGRDAGGGARTARAGRVRVRCLARWSLAGFAARTWLGELFESGRTRSWRHLRSQWGSRAVPALRDERRGVG